jgi:dolichol-phosphate mannosyltransferase
MGRDVSLSVLIPAFNEEKHLERTVDAVRAAVGSTVPNLEILIVDDGSSDATADIARKLEKDDPRVRLLVNPVNLGLGASYKRGLYEAVKTHFVYIPGDNSWPAASPRSSGASGAPTSSRRTRPIRKSGSATAASSRRSTPGW